MLLWFALGEHFAPRFRCIIVTFGSPVGHKVDLLATTIYMLINIGIGDKLLTERAFDHRIGVFQGGSIRRRDGNNQRTIPASSVEEARDVLIDHIVEGPSPVGVLPIFRAFTVFRTCSSSSSRFLFTGLGVHGMLVSFGERETSFASFNTFGLYRNNVISSRGRIPAYLAEL